MCWLVLMDQLMHRECLRCLWCLQLTPHRMFGGLKEASQTLVLFPLCNELMRVLLVAEDYNFLILIRLTLQGPLHDFEESVILWK
jgi:hypothetical protein